MLNSFRMGVLLSLIFLGLVVLVIYPVSSQAATLDAAWVRLSRMQQNLDGAGANSVTVFVGFTAERNTASNSTLTLDFPSDSGWCRNAGTLEIDRDGTSGGDVLDALTESSELAGGNYEVDAYIPDGTTISATCATSGTTITITNIGNLTQGTTYGFYLSSSTGVIGTPNNTGELVTVTITNGANVDSAIFDVELLADDTVTVSATVADAPTITCTLGATTANLGTLYKGGAANSSSHTLTTTTSADATNGFYWTVYGTGDGIDAGLYKSTATVYLLPSDNPVGAGSTPGSVANLTTAEGFGITLAAGTGSETIPGYFDGVTAADVGLLGASGVGGAQLLMYKVSAQTSASAATVTYYARAGATAQAGSFTENVTYSCGLYF